MGAVLSCACDDDQEHAAQQSGRGEQAEAQAAGHHSQDHTPLEDSCTGLCRLSQQRPSGPDNQFAADAGCGAPGELDVNASTHEVVLQLQDAPYATAESRPESQQLRSSLRGCGHPMCISPACQAAVLRILQDKPHCSRRRSLQTPSGCRSTSCPQVAEPINTILAGLAALAGETSGSIAQHGARNTRRSYEWPRSGGPVSQPALGVAASRSHLSCAQWNTPGLASPPASSSNLTSRCSMQSPMAVTALVAVSNIVDNCRAARGGGRVQIRRSGGGRVSLERVHTPRAAQMPNHAAL